MATIRQLTTLLGFGLSVTFSCFIVATAHAVPPTLPGDFDEDGEVDTTDLALWNAAKYLNGIADADGDGESDVDDVIIWKKNEGSFSGALQPLSPANEPHLQYNPGNGQLAIVATGYDIFAFNVTMLSASLSSVTDANLPASWDVQQFNLTVQAFDGSILGDPSPVVGNFPLSLLSGPAVIAQLPAGLSSVAAQLHYGLTDDSDGFSTLVAIVPEPTAATLAVVGLLAAATSRRKRQTAARSASAF